MVKYLFSVLLLVSLIINTSCENNKQENKDFTKVETLTELHSGFSEAELKPEIRNSKDKEHTIVATGHLYPLLKFPLAYKALVDSIKAQDPDYVFILGDIVKDNTQEEWDLFFDFFKDLKDKLYFAPGNHDLNYHYERYFGKRDNQVKAEQCYLNNVGYRYKVLKDNVANYVFINMNDSIHRVLEYIELTEKDLDSTKSSLLLTSQCIWHKKHQDPNNVKTWTEKPFKREELLPYVEHFDYLIHGDWNLKYRRGVFPKSNGKFDVLNVGMRKIGDEIFVSRLDISQDTLLGRPIYVKIPEESKWFK